nr:hypothetical protein [Tanacetum cinerariifolium]
GEPDTQPMLLSYVYVRAILLSEDEAQKSNEKVLAVGDDMDKDHQDDKEVRTPSPKQYHSEPSHVQEYASDSPIKDDPATNQKINESTETFARLSSHVTE